MTMQKAIKNTRFLAMFSSMSVWKMTGIFVFINWYWKSRILPLKAQNLLTLTHPNIWNRWKTAGVFGMFWHLWYTSNYWKGKNLWHFQEEWNKKKQFEEAFLREFQQKRYAHENKTFQTEFLTFQLARTVGRTSKSTHAYVAVERVNKAPVVANAAFFPLKYSFNWWGSCSIIPLLNSHPSGDWQPKRPAQQNAPHRVNALLRSGDKNYIRSASRYHRFQHLYVCRCCQWQQNLMMPLALSPADVVDALSRTRPSHAGDYWCIGLCTNQKGSDRNKTSYKPKPWE